MFNLLKMLFRGHWIVQVVLAVAAFAAAVYLYNDYQRFEAEKAAARAAGMPAAVSLNAFDPARDVHPADEVHVIGWVNPDYNYQLTEEHRRSADTVRRMFVMFGPEDAPDAKVARAVVLMHEDEVDRFADQITANVSGMAGGNPVFALNGTGKTHATLDDMADDALAEKGLTKAPGFRYLEIWPAGGREAGLAATPEVGLYLAGPVAGFGLLLLGVGVFKMRRRKVEPAAAVAQAEPDEPVALAATPAPDAAQAAHDRMMRDISAAEVQAFDAFAGAKGASAQGGISFRTAPPVYQAATPDPAPQAAAPEAEFDAGPVIRTGSSGGRVAKLAAAAVVLAALGLGFSGQLPAGLTDKLPSLDLFSTSPEAPGPAGTAATSDGAAPAPAPARVAESPLIPEAASLRPRPGETGAPAPAPLEAAAPMPAPVAPGNPAVSLPAMGMPTGAPSLGVALSAPARLVATMIAGGQSSGSAPMPVTVPPAAEAPALAETAATTEEAAVPASAEAPAAVAAEAEAAPAPADDGATAGWFALPDLGALSLLAPIAGAVLLAVAALALMRGRQSEKLPAVFAGRDPWDRLAREVRAQA